MFYIGGRTFVSPELIVNLEQMIEITVTCAVLGAECTTNYLILNIHNPICGALTRWDLIWILYLLIDAVSELGSSDVFFGAILFSNLNKDINAQVRYRGYWSI